MRPCYVAQRHGASWRSLASSTEVSILETQAVLCYIQMTRKTRVMGLPWGRHPPISQNRPEEETPCWPPREPASQFSPTSLQLLLLILNYSEHHLTLVRTALSSSQTFVSSAQSLEAASHTLENQGTGGQHFKVLCPSRSSRKIS